MPLCHPGDRIPTDRSVLRHALAAPDIAGRTGSGVPSSRSSCQHRTDQILAWRQIVECFDVRDGRVVSRVRQQSSVNGDWEFTIGRYLRSLRRPLASSLRATTHLLKRRGTRFLRTARAGQLGHISAGSTPFLWSKEMSRSTRSPWLADSTAPKSAAWIIPFPREYEQGYLPSPLPT